VPTRGASVQSAENIRNALDDGIKSVQEAIESFQKAGLLMKHEHETDGEPDAKGAAHYDQDRLLDIIATLRVVKPLAGVLASSWGFYADARKRP
jgi:hypothetical protein